MIQAKSRYIVFGPKKIIIWLGIAIGIGLAVWGIINGARIRNIVCTTEYGSCPDYYVSRLEFLKGRYLFRLMPAATIHSYLSSYVEIGEVSLQRKFPGTLVVLVKLRKPVGIVNDLVVDQTGTLFAPASNSALPKLISPNVYTLSQKINEQEVVAVKYLETLSSLTSEPLEGVMLESLVTIKFSGIELLLDTNQLDPGWNDSLQLILARSKIDGKVPKKIDMRFNNPIIVY